MSTQQLNYNLWLQSSSQLPEQRPESFDKNCLRTDKTW